jgi:catechol 2,3-dioxygenase-like lactoylglutathione lyase family enzyme
MLSDHDAIATIAVKDLGRARKFYEDTLGLEVEAAEEMGVLTCRSGDSKIFVYESQYAGTNQATAATWAVEEDVQEIARALKAKGVAFEHYDFPDSTRDGDVHVMGDVRAAWFKDPDGNILSIVNG